MNLLSYFPFNCEQMLDIIKCLFSEIFFSKIDTQHYFFGISRSCQIDNQNYLSQAVNMINNIKHIRYSNVEPVNIYLVNLLDDGV